MQFRIFFTLLICILLAFVAVGCGEDAYETTVISMDTIVSIKAYGQNAEQAVHKAIGAIEEVDKLANPYDMSSEISRINQAAGVSPVQVSDLTFGLINEALQIARATGGAFDPTVGPLVNLWNIGNGDHLPTKEEISRQLDLIDFDKVRMDFNSKQIMLEREGMSLNLGGVAKGYAVRNAVKSLKDSGVSSALVSAGGNVYAIGTRPDGKPWRIAIKHPRNLETVLGYLELKDRAMDTSGDYYRYFEKDGVRYHHLLDPHTGYPARGLVSATIVSDDPVEADSLATAVFIMGPERGMEFIENTEGLEGVLVTEEMEILLSSGLKHAFMPIAEE